MVMAYFLSSGGVCAALPRRVMFLVVVGPTFFFLLLLGNLIFCVEKLPLQPPQELLHTARNSNLKPERISFDSGRRNDKMKNFGILHYFLRVDTLLSPGSCSFDTIGKDGEMSQLTRMIINHRQKEEEEVEGASGNLFFNSIEECWPGWFIYWTPSILRCLH